MSSSWHGGCHVWGGHQEGVAETPPGLSVWTARVGKEAFGDGIVGLKGLGSSCWLSFFRGSKCRGGSFHCAQMCPGQCVQHTPHSGVTCLHVSQAQRSLG
jgi:hypothetical protein